VQRLIRNPKDFWSGLIFLAFGLAAIVIARDYSMGSAGRMGPAYFPTMLGGILAVIGLAAVFRSLARTGEAVQKFALKEVTLILLATLLFGFLVRGAGLVVAIVGLVMLSGYASTKFKAGPFLVVAIGMAAFCSLIFVKGLSLPMPIFGSWLGF
jgi:putative tricarboxylic transport membrane protein